MTNSKSLFDLLEGAVNFAGRNLTDDFYSPAEPNVSSEDSGPKRKLASEISAGDVVIFPSGAEHQVQSVSLVENDDECVEISFVGYPTKYPLKNFRLVVK